MNEDINAITQALAAPFEASEVKFKPTLVSGSRALATAYVDVRVIQDRLDDVLGVMGWQDSYECLSDGAVVCRLRVRLGDEWITKEDVGGESEQPDSGDRRKAAFSDALKRAAVKFGIGRFLYRLKPQWVDFDPQKKQFVKMPRLPDSALPRPKPVAAAPPKPLYQRAADYEAALVKRGDCKAGDLLLHIMETLGDRYGNVGMDDWPAESLDEVMAACMAYAADCRRKVTQEELKSLGDEMKRVGVVWGQVMTRLRMPEKTPPAEITGAQWTAAMRAVRQEGGGDGQAA